MLQLWNALLVVDYSDVESMRELSSVSRGQPFLAVIEAIICSLSQGQGNEWFCLDAGRVPTCIDRAGQGEGTGALRAARNVSKGACHDKRRSQFLGDVETYAQLTNRSVTLNSAVALPPIPLLGPAVKVKMKLWSPVLHFVKPALPGSPVAGTLPGFW
jgi:hypothetical protein